MTLRAGLNGLFLHYPHSGTGRYLRQLILGLSDDVDLNVVSAAAFPSRFEESFPAPSVRVVSPFDRRFPSVAKVWFEQVTYGNAIRRARVDLSHVPYFAAPVFPLAPTVVTVHDVIPIVNPDYRRTAGQRLYVALVVAGLRSTRLIITDSQASAIDLVRLTGSPVEKIRVIPLGVDERFHPVRDHEEKAVAETVRRHCGVDLPYLLCVTAFDRRKNVDRLIQAFALARQQHQIRQILVVVGAIRADDRFFYDPRPDIEKLGLHDAVRLLGARTDEEVWALLNGADAFVFPSLYEGFGLPPLEAMACGTPVISSWASSLPEVVGDAGVLFDPLDEQSMAGAIASVARDPERRADLSAKALVRAAGFSWSTTVERTVQVYHEVLATSS